MYTIHQSQCQYGFMNYNKQLNKEYHDSGDIEMNWSKKDSVSLLRQQLCSGIPTGLDVHCTIHFTGTVQSVFKLMTFDNQSFDIFD
jgi:hypothetical protein